MKKKGDAGWLKIIWYVLAAATFFGLMAVDNPQVLRASRTAVAVAVIYALSGFAGVYIFGGFDTGKRKVRDITNSLLLVQIFTDMCAYVMLMFMNTNEFTDNVFRLTSKKLLVLCLALHVAETVLFPLWANRLYFKLHAGERCCVVAAKGADEKNVRAAMASKNVDIEGFYSFDDDGRWQEKVRECDTTVILALPPDRKAAVMEYAYKYDKNIFFSPDISDIIGRTSEHQMFEDSLMFYSPATDLSMGQRVAKRAMDLVFSLIMLVLTSPLWLVSAIMIKLDDGGRVIFSQERATKGGRAFRIYKFRTMRESSETRPVSENDDRITKPGRILRRTRLDELPQLLNIIKGDMSLVGPRPEQLRYIHGFDDDYEEYEYRLKVKAGLTGYAQIEGRYNTGNKDKLMLDLMYIRNYSIWLDVKLIFQTVLVFFKKESTSGF